MNNLHVEACSALTTESSSNLNSSTTFKSKYESIYYQVHRHIDNIQKFQLNTDLNTKEKVILTYSKEIDYWVVKLICKLLGRTIESTENIV